MLATEQQTIAYPVIVSSSSQLEPGQTVYAVGAPLGLELTISDGIVSGLRKAVGGFIIQTTAAISPGSSGGGLFDNNGRLVGITTYQYVKGQNLNFAVPADWVQHIALRESLEEKLRVRRAEYSSQISALGSIGKDRNRDLEVIRVSKQYLQDDPAFIQALFNLGYALGKSDNPTAAEPVYVKLIDLPASSFDDYFLIGAAALDLSTIYNKSDRQELARKAASKAAAYIPDTMALGHYWSFLETANHYREAVPIYMLATDLFPKSPEAWAYLGGSYMNLNELDNAKRAYSKAIQLKDDYEWAWMGYIVTLRKADNRDELEKVVRYLSDNQPELLKNMVKALKLK